MFFSLQFWSWNRLNQVCTTEQIPQPTFLLNICGQISDSVEVCIRRHVTHAYNTHTCTFTPTHSHTVHPYICTQTHTHTCVHTHSPEVEEFTAHLRPLLGVADSDVAPFLPGSPQLLWNTPFPLEPVAVSSSLLSQLSPGVVTPGKDPHL